LRHVTSMSPGFFNQAGTARLSLAPAACISLYSDGHGRMRTYCLQHFHQCSGFRPIVLSCHGQGITQQVKHDSHH